MIGSEDASPRVCRAGCETRRVPTPGHSTVDVRRNRADDSDRGSSRPPREIAMPTAPKRPRTPARRLPRPSRIEEALRLIALVANPTRLMVLLILAEGERTVGDLGSLGGEANRAPLSVHL